MSRWSFVICDTQTGAQLTPAFPASGSWARNLNVGASSSHVIRLGDVVNKTLGYRSCTVGWQHTLVVQRDYGAGFGVKPWIAYAGVITGRKRDETANTLTVRHTDIRGLLARRTTLGENGYGGDIDGGSDPILNMTLDSIAARVIRDGLVGPTSNYALPIVLPAPVAGGISQTYYDYNFPFVDQILDDLQAWDGGPDTEFVPRWSDGNTLEWVFRSGYLTGGVFEWVMATENNGLVDVAHDEDASKQATDVYAVGKGSGMDMKVKWARLTSSPLPALVRVQQYKAIDVDADLQSHANGDLNSYKTPTNQWELSIWADGPYQLSQLVLGSTLKLYYQGDDYEPDGWVVLRLIGFAGDMTDKVKLIVQGGWPS